MQIILVGDFFQLPPVVKMEEQSSQKLLMAMSEIAPRFAYDASCWKKADFITCYLTEQHRQEDNEFLSILSAIRHNEYGESHHAYIEKRKINKQNIPDDIPRLFSHNADVDRVNEQELTKLSQGEQIFEMTSQGTPAIVEALKKGCLSPEILKLKVGAKVMFTKNNPRSGFVNGTLGDVEELNPDSSPTVRLRGGRSIMAEPMDWTVEEGGNIKARIKKCL